MPTKKAKSPQRSKKLKRAKTLNNVKPLSKQLNPQPLPPAKLPPGLF